MMDCRQCIALYTNWPFQSAAQLLEPTSSVPMIVHHVFFPVVLSLTIEAVECFHTMSWSELQCQQNACSGYAA